MGVRTNKAKLSTDIVARRPIGARSTPGRQFWDSIHGKSTAIDHQELPTGLLTVHTGDLFIAEIPHSMFH